MSRICYKSMVMLLCVTFIFALIGKNCPIETSYANANSINYKSECYYVNPKGVKPKKIEKEVNQKTETEVPESKSTYISDSDINLIALITMAEAEAESEEGKRLVIDTILNRVDSTHFPNTVTDVIYQPNQFESVWNSRVDRCEIKDSIKELVLEELENRLNYDVIFFTAGKYSDYGVPMFQLGHHYFSRY